MAKRQFELTQHEIDGLRRAEQQTRDVHELRRLQAVRLYGSGVSTKQIAEVVGCGRGSPRQWAMRYRAQGVTGLASHWQGGNANKLTTAQRADLAARLEQYRPDQVLPAEIRVERGSFWSINDLRLAVQQWYGVSYRSEGSYRNLLQACGLSYQKVERVYRSQPSAEQIAAFEQELEKK
jgi:transposase